ncbi:hypothetical protein DCM91_00110 [Chitinophaga costaii]|nr:hypothetical protein DCM91_00110 [Chitinophaga costaii]
MQDGFATSRVSLFMVALPGVSPAAFQGSNTFGGGTFWVTTATTAGLAKETGVWENAVRTCRPPTAEDNAVS